MSFNKVQQAKRKKTEIINKLKDLRKKVNNETDKKKKKQLKTQIKKLQNSLPYIKRTIYEGSKDPVRDKQKAYQNERLIEKELNRERDRLSGGIKRVASSFSKEQKQSNLSKKVCSSCGTPINSSYGLSRCRCN
jgi:CCR4-NOT transcriptional regulation complex NOT5 subunit